MKANLLKILNSLFYVGISRMNYCLIMYLNSICDYYFENRKYQALSRIASSLNFSQYIHLEELEAVWKMKNLTTTLIHLIITSNQSGYDSWTKILNGVFKWFQSISNHIDLDDIKHIYNKSKEDKNKIESSYEYVGLKLMSIVRLFIKGEKFPEGKLSKDDHLVFLLQSINFITENNISVEFFKVNAKSFFTVVSEIFINSDLSITLAEMNEVNEKGEKSTLIVLLESIIDKLNNTVSTLWDIDNLRFEFCLFILKISCSKWIKENAKQFSPKVTDSILYILTEISNYTTLKRINSRENLK